MCVPGTHNAILGGSWGAMVRGQASGTVFRFKIKGFNCSTVPTTRKRNLDEFRIYDEEDDEAEARAEANRARHAIWHKLRQTGGAIIRNDTSSVVVDGPLVFGNFSEGKYALIAPLPSPDNDTFQGVMQISWTLAQGMIEKGFIIDDDGETYQTYASNDTVVSAAADSALPQVRPELRRNTNDLQHRHRTRRHWKRNGYRLVERCKLGCAAYDKSSSYGEQWRYHRRHQWWEQRQQ